MYKNVFGGDDRPQQEGKGWPIAETPDLQGVADLGVDRSFEQMAVRRLAVVFPAGFFSRFIGFEMTVCPLDRLSIDPNKFIFTAPSEENEVRAAFIPASGGPVSGAHAAVHAWTPIKIM